MATITVEQTTFRVIDEGMYTLTVQDLEVVDGQFGKQIKFRFQVQGEGNEDVTLLSWCSMKFSAGSKPSKLYDLTKAILGVPSIPEGMAFTDDLVIGKSVGALVKVVDVNGMQRNKIDAFFPIKKAAKPAPQAAKPVAAQEMPF